MWWRVWPFGHKPELFEAYSYLARFQSTAWRNAFFVRAGILRMSPESLSSSGDRF
jgi:hypothetical protein